MKTIALTQGLVAVVSNRDYKDLSQWKWYAVWFRKHRTAYAYRQVRVKPGKQRALGMHVHIMMPADGKEVDHRNGNGLDNQRRNLRVCGRARNTQNRRKSLNNTSGFKGVSKMGKKWKSEITRGRRRFYLGVFSDRLSAAKAYDRAAARLFGKFACPNFL